MIILKQKRSGKENIKDSKNLCRYITSKLKTLNDKKMHQFKLN